VEKDRAGASYPSWLAQPPALLDGVAPSAPKLTNDKRTDGATVQWEATGR